MKNQRFTPSGYKDIEIISFLVRGKNSIPLYHHGFHLYRGLCAKQNTIDTFYTLAWDDINSIPYYKVRFMGWEKSKE